MVNRHIIKLRATPIQLTTSQVQEAITNSKINNSTGHKINIRPGTTWIVYLTQLYTLVLNINIILHI